MTGKLKKRLGFTLIEILLVIAIIFIFSTYIIVNYKKNQPTYALLGVAQKMSFNLRRAQNMAMSSKEFHGKVPQGGYGVYFPITPVGAVGNYIIFADCDGSKDYNTSGLPCEGNFSEKAEEIVLEGGVKISSILCSPACSLNDRGYVVFIPPDPTIIIGPANVGDNVTDINIALSVEGGPVRTITVNKVGKIDIE